MKQKATLDDESAHTFGSNSPLNQELLESAFASAHIKSLLQEEEGMGILLKPAIDLVGSCSAAFIHDLMSKAMIESQNVRHENGDESTSSRLSFDSLQRVIANNDEFRILRGVLDGLQNDLDNSTKSTSLLLSGLHTKKRPADRKPKADAKPRPAKKSATAKLAKGILRDVVDEPAVDLKEDATIVADEEDYD
jgi:hypothetical protein